MDQLWDGTDMGQLADIDMGQPWADIYMAHPWPDTDTCLQELGGTDVCRVSRGLHPLAFTKN